MEKPKFCVDCRWYRPEMYDRFFWIAPRPMAAKYARCGHPSQLSLVDGSVAEYCTMKRDKHSECGPDAKLWEAKDERKMVVG